MHCGRGCHNSKTPHVVRYTCQHSSHVPLKPMSGVAEEEREGEEGWAGEGGGGGGEGCEYIQWERRD